MKKLLVYGLIGNLGRIEQMISRTLLNIDISDIEVHALVYEKTILYNELKDKGVIFHFITRR